MDLFCRKGLKPEILGVLGALLVFSACQDNSTLALGDENPSIPRSRLSFVRYYFGHV